MKSRSRGLATAAIAALFTITVNDGSAQTAYPNADSHRFKPASRPLDRETDTADASTGAAARGVEPVSGGPFREAPAAFDNKTNGFDAQGPAFDTLTED